MQYLPGQYLFMITYFKKNSDLYKRYITISSTCMHVYRDEAYHVHRYQNFYFFSKKRSLLWKCQNYRLRTPYFDLCLPFPAVKRKGSLSCKLLPRLGTTRDFSIYCQVHVGGTVPIYSHLVSLSRTQTQTSQLQNKCPLGYNR